MNSEYPSISIVIIGLNVEKHIEECITSISKAEYPDELLEIIYVDGGSSDSSVSIATRFKNIKIIELNDPNPTPGKGRNAGYKAARHNLIQFLDADTTIEPGWLKIAVSYITEKNGAVAGRIIEKYPTKNRYHLIGNIEWNISTGKDGYKFSNGPCKTFGGIVLIRKEVLERVNGYDESLIAGEDPDLSYRVRLAGWIIYQINTEMVNHDLNMNSFKQYLKRAFRSGHAYAEIGLRYIKYKEKYFARQLFRILAAFILPLAIIIFGVIQNRSMTGIFLALLLIFRPLIKVLVFKNKYKLNLSHAFLYGLHLSLIVYPQFMGVLRYLFSCFFGFRLENKGCKPVTSKKTGI